MTDEERIKFLQDRCDELDDERSELYDEKERLLIEVNVLRRGKKTSKKKLLQELTELHLVVDRLTDRILKDEGYAFREKDKYNALEKKHESVLARYHRMLDCGGPFRWDTLKAEASDYGIGH